MAILSMSQSMQAERCKQSFALFAKESWPLIEPGVPYVGNWHLDAIAEHLQAVVNGDITRLLVNMPPRHGKSSYISVLIFCWSWLQDPSMRWLCASYAMNLATRDNLKCRRIIKSPWFQARYGHLFTLTKDQDAKMKFENNFTGYRQAVSVGSAGTTGEGGDILLIDDPHPIEQKRSDLKREAVLDWFANTWSSRLNDEATGRMVVVGQRVHSQDVSGYIIDGNLGRNWTHLNLAAEYEPESPCRTSWPGESWRDPRTQEGELLWPEKFDEEVIEQKKRIHGPLGYAAIYQQRPVPAGGNIYKANDRRYFSIEPITKSYLLQTPQGRVTVPISDCYNLGVIDLATSTRETADYFVFETWAITPYKDALLLECVHAHFSFPEQVKQIPLIFQRYMHAVIAVEKAGYQLAMIQHLVSEGFPIKPFTPQADKVTRSTTGSIFYSNGKAYHLIDMLNIADVEKELFTFPKAPNDDIADCHAMMALVVSTLRRPGVLDLDNDVKAIDTTLSIEQIIKATAENKAQEIEQEKIKEAELKELFEKGPQISVWEWASEHEGAYA